MPRTLNPDVAEARRLIAEKGFWGARAAIVALREKEPNNADLRALLALVHLWTGDVEAARELLPKVPSGADSASLAAVAAEVAYFMAENQLADQFLKRAIELDSEHFLTFRSSWNEAQMSGENERALEILQRSLEVYPEDPEVWASLVTSKQHIGDVAAAQKLLDTPPDWVLGTVQYCNKVGMVALTRGDLAAAEASLRDAVSMCPEGGAYWGHLSMVLFPAGKIEEAEQAAKFALELNSRNCIALRTLSKIALSRGDKKAAAEFEDRATEAVPCLAEQHLSHQMNALIRQGKTDAAIKKARLMQQSNRDYLQRQGNRFHLDLLTNNQRWEAARDEWTRLESENRIEPSMRLNHIRIIDHFGDTKQALHELDEVLQSVPPDRNVYPLALEMYLRNGMVDDADRIVEMLIADLPGLPAQLVMSIIALDRGGRGKDARRLYDAARRKFPSYKGLAVIGAGMAAQDGRLGNATYMIQNLPTEDRERLHKAAKRGLFKALAKHVLRRWFGIGKKKP